MDLEAIRKRDESAKVAREFIEMNGLEKRGGIWHLLQSQRDVSALIAEIERLRDAPEA